MSDHEQLIRNEVEVIQYTGLVYHGTTAHQQDGPRILPFNYGLSFTNDYQPGDFHPNSEDASLGYGLYTTPVPARAVQYTSYHQYHYGGETPGVVSLRLDNYPLLNWVDPDHPSRNKMVPLELAESWYTYFVDNQHQIKGNGQTKEAQNSWVQERVSDYWGYLEQLVDRLRDTTPDKPADLIDIHDLLGTGRGQPATGFGTSPVWGGYWARFLAERYGANGMIAAQGVEYPSWGTQPTMTVVLYDLDEQLVATQQVQGIKL